MSLPSGYKRLEYIQSSGTQYIDTLFNPTQNTQLVLDVAFLGSAGTNVAGVRNNSRDTTNRFGIISFGSTSKLGAFFRDSSIQAVTFDNNRHLYDLSKDGLVFDGTSYGGANTGSFSCTYSLTLFAWNNGADGVTCNLCKVYSCQIYDNGTLVRDFVPCINASGEVSLYDLVDKQFYGNAGTGTFTAGPIIAIAADKSEITKLEYIQSTGTQFIDTGFIPNQDTRIDIDAIPLSIAETSDGAGFIPYGAGVSNNNRAFECYSSMSKYEFNYDGQYNFVGSPAVGQRLKISHNKNNVSLIVNGGTPITLSFTYQTFTAPYTMTLFAIHRSSLLRGLMKLYSCQIYDNGTLIRDFIPCQKPDGTIGLYDKLNGLLYVNAGTGAFEAGPSSLNLPVNIGGTWKEANEAFVNIGGTWKTVKDAFVNIGGTWKELG